MGPYAGHNFPIERSPDRTLALVVYIVYKFLCITASHSKPVGPRNLIFYLSICSTYNSVSIPTPWAVAGLH